MDKVLKSLVVIVSALALGVIFYIIVKPADATRPAAVSGKGSIVKEESGKETTKTPAKKPASNDTNAKPADGPEKSEPSTQKPTDEKPATSAEPIKEPAKEVTKKPVVKPEPTREPVKEVTKKPVVKPEPTREPVKEVTKKPVVKPEPTKEPVKETATPAPKPTVIPEPNPSNAGVSSVKSGTHKNMKAGVWHSTSTCPASLNGETISYRTGGLGLIEIRNGDTFNSGCSWKYGYPAIDSKLTYGMHVIGKTMSAGTWAARGSECEFIFLEDLRTNKSIWGSGGYIEKGETTTFKNGQIVSSLSECGSWVKK